MAKALITRNRRAGLKASKKMAEDLGCYYMDPVGAQDGGHPIISLENKRLSKFAGEKIMFQAEVNCPAGKIAVARVHLKDSKYDRDIVMIRVRDFKYFLELAEEANDSSPSDKTADDVAKDQKELNIIVKNFVDAPNAKP